MASCRYDALRDFQPVTQITGVPGALVVHPAVPATSVKELVALAKSKPAGLNFGSGGVGTPVHMAGELLKLAANIEIVHIPYKGAGPAFTDLLGGHFQLMFPTLQSAVPHIKSGRLRLLALTSENARPLSPTCRSWRKRECRAWSRWRGLASMRPGHAASHRRACTRRSGQDPAGPGGQATLHFRRRRCHRQFASAIRQIRRGRNRQVDQGRKSKRYQGGVSVRTAESYDR